MKNYIIGLFVLGISVIACTPKKKNASTEVSEEVKIEIEKVEKSLDEISTEVKTKSKELDDALQALDDI